MTPEEPRFERLRHLGSGSSARVDLARLSAPFGPLPAGAEVAVKTFAPRTAKVGTPSSGDHEAGRAAFRAEADAARLARDPSLVRVLHHGEERGVPYLLLQYVPGRTLREASRDGPMPEPLVRRIGAQLAGALAALHDAGFAHGDVKPENVRLDDAGRAVLLDLGFAHRVDEGVRASDAGSLAYLSPERADGGPPSPAADVFALGVVLYELATGTHPFGYAPDGTPAAPRPSLAVGHGSSSGALLHRTLEQPGADELLAAIRLCRIVPASHLVPPITPFFDALSTELLARRPQDRPNARELSTRLTLTESSPWWRAQVDPRRRSPTATPAPGLRRQTTPLVGRDAEMALLARTLEGVRAGRPAVAWIASQPGCGRWRLVNEFAARARASQTPPVYLYARWGTAAEARPAGVLLILLHRWLRLPTETEPGPREERVLEELVGRRVARTLMGALSPRGVHGSAPTSAASVDSVPGALARWLEALSRSRPVLVFVDELHRAGPVTLESLSILLDGLAGRVLLLLGVREDVEATDAGLARLRARLDRLERPDPDRASTEAPFDVLTLALGPLDRAAMRELVDGVFDHGVARGRLAEVLWLRTRGNPGLASEILVDLIADGDAYPAGEHGEGKLLLAIAPDDLPLPRSLDGIVTERVRALAPTDRRWLQRLAVVGGRIAPDFLQRAFPPTGRAEIDEVLARLVRLGWLVPAADRYRFARPALREALYRSLGDAQRERWHLAAARGLEPDDPAREPSTEERYQRAFHLRAANRHAEVLELAHGLVRKERYRTSARRLLTLARWALEAMEHLPRDPDDEAAGSFDRVRLELLEAAADAADRLGRRDEERELLDYLLDLDLDLTRHPAEGARLYLLHARYATGTGRFGLARGMLRNAIQLAETVDDDELVSEARRRMGQVQAHIGELAEARDQARIALERAADAHQIALARLALAHVDVLEDRLEDAQRHVERAEQALRGASERPLRVAAYAHLLRARIWRSLGRPVRAFWSARRAVELARRTGERKLEAEARGRLGGLLLDLDRPDEAEVELRDAELLADEIEDRRGQVLARLWLGVLLLEERDDDTAGGMIERATELAHEIGFYRAEALAQAMLARVHRHRAELERADELSAAALELLARHGAELTDRIVIAGTRALVLRQRGRRRASKALVRELERRIARSQELIADDRLRRDQRAFADSLLRAVLSPDGPVFPRRQLA